MYYCIFALQLQKTVRWNHPVTLHGCLQLPSSDALLTGQENDSNSSATAMWLWDEDVPWGILVSITLIYVT